MKLIILDYFRRRGLLLAVIFIAYFIIEAWSVAGGFGKHYSEKDIAAIFVSVQSTMAKAFLFPLIIYLATFLMMDKGLGYTRVLNTLPLTAKKIGRALWLTSVALPAIAFVLLGTLALLIFSNHQIIQWKAYLTNWLFLSLALGAAFGGLTFANGTLPLNFIGRLRMRISTALPMLVVFGWIFTQLLPSTPTRSILVFTALTALSAVGWFRAEKIILPRANFNPTTSTNLNNFAPEKVPMGFGGLPYLALGTFAITTLIGLAMLGMMILFSYVLRSPTTLNRVEMVTSMVDGGSTAFIFIFISIAAPMVFQIRLLRTFPVSASVLAAVMVLVPVACVAVNGLVATIFAAWVAGPTVIPHILNTIFILEAKAAIVVSVMVWRGLDAVTYLIMFLLVIADSFIALGITMHFHLGTRNTENPVWIALAIFLAFVAISFALTRMLLTQNSSPYRARTMPANAWSMMRR